MKTIANRLTRLLAVAATAVAITALVGAGNGNRSSHPIQPAPVGTTSVHHPCAQLVRYTAQAPSDNSMCSPTKVGLV